jgi:hypothetical protein
MTRTIEGAAEADRKRWVFRWRWNKAVWPETVPVNVSVFSASPSPNGMNNNGQRIS